MTLINELSPENLSHATPSPNDDVDVLVIGAGMSGLSAGLYAARAGWKTLVLEGALMSSVDYPGGQLMLTPEIENYPGFASGSGAELINITRGQAEAMGASIQEGRVERIDFDPQGVRHVVHTDLGETYAASKVILATGAIARRLGVPGEDDFYGRGVSSCATCDGSFFAGKTVAVVGGGDVAVEDALYMTQHADHVYLIHRRDSLRASSPQAISLLQHPNVTVLWNTQVVNVNGSAAVESVDLISDKGAAVLPVSGLFVAIGHDPQSELAMNDSALIEVDGYGYIVAQGTKTNLPGVFVSGDVADSVYRQAVTAAATGAMAAIDATRELSVERHSVSN